MRRPIRPAAGFITTAVAMLMFASLPLPTNAAALWTLKTSTVSVHGPSTKIVLTITNLGLTTASSYDIGCVKVSIPAAVDVTATAIGGVTNGRSWGSSLVGAGPSVVTASVVTNADSLKGLPIRDAVDIAVTVKPILNGATLWTVAVFKTKSCTVPSAATQSLAFTVTGGPAPTSTPAPTAKPTPAPTAKPTPAATPRPTSPPAGSSPTPIPAPTQGGPLPSPIPGASLSVETAAPTDIPPDQSSPSPTSISIVVPPVGGGTTGGPGTPDTFTLGGTESTEIGPTIRGLGSLGLGVEWGVPAFVMGVPGLLIILIVLAQALGGSAWLPVVRRRIGSFGIRGPRLPRRT